MIPVFIVGVQRSGTTMLAEMLSKHSLIYIEKKAITFRLITWMNYYSELRYHNSGVDEKEFFKWSVTNDKGHRLADFFNLDIMTKSSSIQNGLLKNIEKRVIDKSIKIWLDKCPNLQFFVPDTLSLFPNARFIHIIRDGRATAISMHKRSNKSLSLGAQEWLEGQTEGLKNQRLLGKNRYLLIKYEDLVVSPNTIMKEISKFLDIPFEESITSPPKHSIKNKYVISNLVTSKIDDWKTNSNERQINKIEKIQGAQLNYFGYPIESNQAINSKPLGIFLKIILRIWDKFKAIFRSESEGMKDGKVVKLKTGYLAKIYQFFLFTTNEIFSYQIFKSLFKRGFYDKKIYQNNSSDK